MEAAVWPCLRGTCSWCWYLAGSGNFSPSGQDVSGQTLHLWEADPVWGSSSCLCKKSAREAHLTRGGKAKEMCHSTYKIGFWWLSSKMLWPAGFPRLDHLWPGYPKSELPGVSAQLCLRTYPQQSSNPAFAVSHGKQVPTLLAFVLQ